MAKARVWASPCALRAVVGRRVSLAWQREGGGDGASRLMGSAVVERNRSRTKTIQQTRGTGSDARGVGLEVVVQQWQQAEPCGS